MTERRLLLSRHIEDIGDLRNNRDCGINPEMAHEAQQIADEIIRTADTEGSGAVLFVISPKIRVRETTEIIRSHIRKESTLKTLLTEEPGLREIDQGTFCLPDDYTTDMYIPELARAWEIFWEETFTNGDFQYRFGSVSSRTNPKAHRELESFFTKPGENYTEYCVRLYRAALKLSKDSRLTRRSGVRLSVITHGAPLAIFKELEGISTDMANDGFDFETGTLMQLCWDRYRDRKVDADPNFGASVSLRFDHISDPRIRSKLQVEVDYLESTLEENGAE